MSLLKLGKEMNNNKFVVFTPARAAKNKKSLNFYKINIFKHIKIFICRFQELLINK